MDKRADIWSFGAVLYEMVTGVRLFRSDEVSDTVALVLTHEMWHVRARDPSWRDCSMTSAAEAADDPKYKEQFQAVIGT